MRIVSCLAMLAVIIATTPAWAADPIAVAALAGPDADFRTPAGAPQTTAINGSASSSQVGGGDSQTPASTGQAPLLGPTRLAATEGNPFQVAQASGTPSPPPPATFTGSPWIFGATVYGWIPFASSESTIDGLPPARTSWPQTNSHLTNLFGGAGEFQLSKGDWGLFGNIAGAYVGIKGEILHEDSRHTTHEDRSGYSHSSSISGQYGLSYRLLGEPLDLAAWARATQPISLDLQAGGQTFYVSSSFDSQREHVSANTTLTSPIVGTRISWDIAPRWNLGLSGSLGGFGVSDTHLTWQANVTIAYRFRMGDVPGAVTLGFRAQGLNFETGSGADYLKVNETLYGPMLGFSIFY